MYNTEELEVKLNSADITRVSDLSEQRVLLRSCLNVIVDKEGNITDRTRLDEAYPTIKYLAENSMKLIVIAHLGRPINQDPNLSLIHVYDVLNQQLQADLDIEVEFATTFAQADQSEAKVVVMENIRFFSEEDSTDPTQQSALVEQLSQLADLYVNDAFPDYRESVSTYYIAQKLRAYLGPNFISEVSALAKLSSPAKPFVALLGGAKLSEKLDTMLELVKFADKIVIGGAMAYTLLKAKGIEIGKSLYEEDKLAVATEIITKFGDKLLLPVDHLIANTFSPEAAKLAINTTDIQIPADTIAIDIGLKTIQQFCAVMVNAQTILVNGPMGVFEWDKSLAGTREVYKAVLSNASAYKVIGGGDSISAINKLMLTGFNHVSTGGGAMLAFIAKSKFPTLDVVIG